jgi:hypothetical protein
MTDISDFQITAKGVAGFILMNAVPQSELTFDMLKDINAELEQIDTENQEYDSAVKDICARCYCGIIDSTRAAAEVRELNDSMRTSRN